MSGDEGTVMIMACPTCRRSVPWREESTYLLPGEAPGQSALLPMVSPRRGRAMAAAADGHDTAGGRIYGAPAMELHNMINGIVSGAQG